MLVSKFTMYIARYLILLTFQKTISIYKFVLIGLVL
jgi:hypothetical protein